MKERSPLSYSAYRILWTSNLTCNTGVLIQTVGASWAIVAAQAPPQLVASVQIASSLPLVLLSPLSGAVSDLLDRRRVMMVAQAVLMAIAVALAFLSWSEHASPRMLIACMFLAGSSLAFNGPAFMAAVGDSVPRGILPDAVIYNAIGLNVARSLGPALGGMLVAAAGVTSNFLVSAGCALGLILVLRRWKPLSPQTVEPPAVGSGQPLLASIAAGVRYVGSSSSIRAALFRTLAFGTVVSGVPALMPLIAHDLLHGGPTTYGLLFSCFGAGAMAGALLSNPLRRLMPAEAIVQLCTLSSAVAVVVAAVSTEALLTAPCVAIVGAAWVIAFSVFNVSVQLASPRWVVARTLSLYQMAAFTGFVLGAWLGGSVADHIGTSGSLLAMSGAGIGTMAGGLFLPIKPTVDH